jgi:hypothetical protein
MYRAVPCAQSGNEADSETRPASQATCSDSSSAPEQASIWAYSVRSQPEASTTVTE